MTQTAPTRQVPEQEPLSVYHDKDCNLDLIKAKKVAVIGYGAQGHAHAQNLKDSGVENLVVALREGSPSIEKAQEAGLQTQDLITAVKDADVVMLLIPDEHQADLYRDHLHENMKQGATLMFAHGLNVHFDLIKPREDLDVSLVAPKGPGYGLRKTYLEGDGIPSLIAVAQDVSGSAKDLALSYAAALGSGRCGILETTFKDECETDLFGEQAVLCGGIPDLIKAGYETLVEAGYPPEMAYFECLHETKLIVDLLYEGGLRNMGRSISNTAEYGGYVTGARLVNDETKAEMRRVLDDIQSGKFVQNFMGGNKEGLSRLVEMRDAEAKHPVEDVGENLRAMMKLAKKN